MHPFEMIYNLNKVPIEEYTEAAICFVDPFCFTLYILPRKPMTLVAG